MRWDSLFDDLEGQLEQELRADELDQRAEEERLRIGRLGLRDRLLAIHGAAMSAPGRSHGETPADEGAVRVILNSGERIDVRPLAFGRDWFTARLVGDGRARRQCVVPLAAVDALVLTGAQVESSLAPVDSEPSLASRLTLPFLLRDLCRRRAAVDVRTLLGDVHGTIDRVGRDHFDLATHESGRARRRSAVIDYRTVPIDRLVLLRL